MPKGECHTIKMSISFNPSIISSYRYELSIGLRFKLMAVIDVISTTIDSSRNWCEWIVLNHIELQVNFEQPQQQSLMLE